MTQDELLIEMESLVEAIEQAFAIVIGILGETGDAGAVLRQLLAAEEAAGRQYGPNGWRDRIVRKMQLIAALKARRLTEGDPSLRSLIDAVLLPLRDPDRAGRH